MLKSIDLFTGIAGFTKGLKEYCEPVAYCDICKTSQTILKTLMSKGRIPKAPIFKDVKEISSKTISGNVDIVMGGFPCQGFSSTGKRNYMEDDRSQLVYEMLRIANDFHADYIFMENVPLVVSEGLSTFGPRFHKAGYDLYWVTLSARSVGAPHTRNRWYCLAKKRGTQRKTIPHVPLKRHVWKNEPPRMVSQNSLTNTRRLMALGNSVVPQCVQIAFQVLSKDIRLQKRVERATSTGAFVNGQWYKWHAPLENKPIDYNIILSKSVAKKNWKRDKNKETDAVIIKSDMHKSIWSTPRKTNTLPSPSLTERCSRDLPTQVRFEKDTPNHLRKGYLNASWVDWLMGYPPEWTAFKEKRSLVRHDKIRRVVEAEKGNRRNAREDTTRDRRGKAKHGRRRI